MKPAQRSPAEFLFRDPGPREFIDGFSRTQSETHPRLEFRNYVVIIGIEPFRHFERRRLLCASLHGKVCGQAYRPTGASKSPWNSSEGDCHIQNMVVERKIV